MSCSATRLGSASNSKSKSFLPRASRPSLKRRTPQPGRGDVNTYALFAELFANLAGPRGRAGVIVPTQIATADTTKEFFGSLITDRHLVSFFNFFEIRQWFVATDDRNPFGLLTIGSRRSDPEFAFWLTAIDQL